MTGSHVADGSLARGQPSLDALEPLPQFPILRREPIVPRAQRLDQGPERRQFTVEPLDPGEGEPGAVGGREVLLVPAELEGGVNVLGHRSQVRGLDRVLHILPSVEGQFANGGQDLEYGVSVTDACVSWQTTEEMLEAFAKAVRARRGGAL